MFLKQQKELLIFEVEYCSCILYNWTSLTG
jgi:hypothetical protein